MSWYVWKRWRFAWGCSLQAPMSAGVRDGNGEWMCLAGKLYFLIKKTK